jgi:hypothetical protein
MHRGSVVLDDHWMQAGNGGLQTAVDLGAVRFGGAVGI